MKTRSTPASAGRLRNLATNLSSCLPGDSFFSLQFLWAQRSLTVIFVWVWIWLLFPPPHLFLGELCFLPAVPYCWKPPNCHQGVYSVWCVVMCPVISLKSAPVHLIICVFTTLCTCSRPWGAMGIHSYAPDAPFDSCKISFPPEISKLPAVLVAVSEYQSWPLLRVT